MTVSEVVRDRSPLTRPATEPIPRPAHRHETRRLARPARTGALLPIVLAATFVQLLDATIVNVAIPAVRADLAATPGEIQLVLAGYQLAFACTLVAGGRLGDRFGRKRCFLVGMLAFVAASIGCAMADSGSALVITRLLQGTASGLMFPQVLSVIQVSVPGVDKPKAFGLYGATVGLSTVLGPVLGGVLLDPLGQSWRSVFWVNVPIGLVAVAAAIRWLPESRAPQVVRIDLLSVGLAGGGLFLLMMPLVLGRDQGWPWWTFASMASGALVLTWFTLRQRRLGDAALVAPGLFRDRNLRLGVLMNLVFFAGIGPFFFVLVLTLQAGLGHDALAAGLTTVPFALAGALASGRSAGLARRLGTTVLVVGCALLVVGHAGVIGTLYAHGRNLQLWQLAPALAVAGFGMGLFVAPVTKLILAEVRPQEAGAASGVLATAQQVAGAFGIAVLGVVFFGLIGSNAAPAVHADTGLRQALAGLQPPQAAAVQAAVADCYHARVTATDTTVTPAACSRLPQVLAVLPNGHALRVTQAMGAAMPRVASNDFQTSLRQALVWEVAVFGLAGLLALRLSWAGRPAPRHGIVRQRTARQLPLTGTPR
jgi:EmrB/QacA subfamily drug resistance transporter